VFRDITDGMVEAFVRRADARFWPDVSASRIRVEVAYALPQRQLLRRVTLDQGSCVGDALAASGLLEEFRRSFGAAGSTDARAAGLVLRDRDRVEIYRPLRADPKEIRRRRAATRRAIADQLQNCPTSARAAAFCCSICASSR